MPVLYKAEDHYWVTDEDLVTDLKRRLEALLLTDLGKAASFVRDTFQYVKSNQRFSIKQEWAIRKIEDAQSADPNTPAWLYSAEEFPPFSDSDGYGYSDREGFY